MALGLLTTPDRLQMLAVSQGGPGRVAPSLGPLCTRTVLRQVPGEDTQSWQQAVPSGDLVPQLLLWFFTAQPLEGMPWGPGPPSLPLPFLTSLRQFPLATPTGPQALQSSPLSRLSPAAAPPFLCSSTSCPVLLILAACHFRGLFLPASVFVSPSCFPPAPSLPSRPCLCP